MIVFVKVIFIKNMDKPDSRLQSGWSFRLFFEGIDPDDSVCVAFSFLSAAGHIFFMARGPYLTKIEQTLIFQLKAAGLSNRKIAEALERSLTVVKTFLRNPKVYNIPKNEYRRRKISETGLRLMMRTAQKEEWSSKKLKDEQKLDICDRHVRRLLNDPGDMVFKRKKRTLMFTKKHMLNRVDFCRKWLRELAALATIIFSDYKKFSLDGPDGLKKCWVRKDGAQKFCLKRHSGGGKLHVWGAFWMNGRLELVFVEGSVKAVDHVALLDEHLLPHMIAHLSDGNGFTGMFQQDNARPHSAKLTQAYLRDHGVPVMKWPAQSPDLNPMENAWGMISQKIYAQGKQYNSKKALKAAIIEAWQSIEQSTLAELIKSMERRFKDCIEVNGRKTKY